MKAAIILSAFTLVLGESASPAFAAHAGKPYANVHHKNDAGNDTGDAKVGHLNAGS